MPTPTINKKEPNIRKLYKPSDAEHDVLQHVYDRKRDMADTRQPFEAQWDKCAKQWEAYREPKNADDWKSNIYIPMTTSIIEAQLAEIINQDMMPWVVARGAEDEPKAEVMNAILRYTWDVSKSNVALFQIIKDALIYGTGIGMEFFWREPRVIQTKDGKGKEVLEFDDCYLQPIKLEDFYADERGQSFTGPKQLKDCIWRNIMDYDDFRTFFKGKIWDPNGQAELVKPGGDTNFYEFYKPPEKLDHSREVEVLWYFSKAEDKFVVVANDVVVRNEANPYKHKQLPFVRALDIYRPFRFYGKGESELLESLQEEVNTLRRMIIDRNHLDIDKPILTSDVLTLEDEDAMAAPHKIIPVGDVTQIKFPEYSDIPQSVFKSLEMLNSDKVRVTGMDESQQSVQQAGTATEAAILKEATLKRLNLKMWHIKNDTLVDIGRIRVSNIMQFYSQPKLQEITGEDMVNKAKAEGRLVLSEGKNYRKSYRNIRLQDEAVSIDQATRQPTVKPTKGYTFFEANPRFFMPAFGSYDIRYKASSQIPISKPLEQQKADEMYDRLIKNPAVDQWKLAEYLLKSRELSPDDFKVKKEGEQEPEGPQIAQMVDLASVENEEMMNGNALPPTPYASVVHTQIHIDFINTDKFRKGTPVNDDSVLQNFSNHIMGEIAAQMARKGQAMPTGNVGGMNLPQGAQLPQTAEGMAPNPMAPQMGNVVPSRIEGGGQVPSGMAGSNSGVQVGRKV
jgi:hypothetical protein